MRKILIVTFAVLSASLSATLYADQNEEKLAMMELEKDYQALVNEPKQKNRRRSTPAIPTTSQTATRI